MRREEARLETKANETAGEVVQGHLAHLARGDFADGEDLVIVVSDEDAAAVEVERGRLDAHDASCLLEDLLAQLGRGLHDGHARNVRAGARVGAAVERRGVRVDTVHHDAVGAATENLGRELGKDRVATSAHVGRAHVEHVEAVILEAQVDRSDVDVGNAGALHGEGDAQRAHTVAQVAGERLVLPIDHLHGAT